MCVLDESTFLFSNWCVSAGLKNTTVDNSYVLFGFTTCYPTSVALHYKLTRSWTHAVLHALARTPTRVYYCWHSCLFLVPFYRVTAAETRNHSPRSDEAMASGNTLISFWWIQMVTCCHRAVQLWNSLLLVSVSAEGFSPPAYHRWLVSAYCRFTCETPLLICLKATTSEGCVDEVQSIRQTQLCTHSASEPSPKR